MAAMLLNRRDAEDDQSQEIEEPSKSSNGNSSQKKTNDETLDLATFGHNTVPNVSGPPSSLTYYFRRHPNPPCAQQQPMLMTNDTVPVTTIDIERANEDDDHHGDGTRSAAADPLLGIDGAKNGKSGDYSRQPLMSNDNKTEVAPVNASKRDLSETANKLQNAKKKFQVVRQWIEHRKPPKKTKRLNSFLNKFAMGGHSDQETTSCGGLGRCLTHWIVDPTSGIYYLWLGIISFVVLYNILLVVARAAFWKLQNRNPTLWFISDYVGDIFYLMDMVINAHKGYLEQGLLVKDLHRIRLNYVKSKQFICDAVSILPTDLAYFAIGTECLSCPCPVIVRLNRVLRFPRMIEFFDRTETRTNFPNVFRVTKLVIYILIIIHWNACLYFVVSYSIGFASDDWVYPGVSNSTDPESLQHMYIYSIYWSTLTLTTIGETPPPEKDIEYLFVVCEFLVSVLIFATIVGNVGSMITNMNAARAEFQASMDKVKRYMGRRKVGPELERRVIHWFDYLWVNKQSLDEHQIMSVLPDKLRAEIAIHVHMDTLRRVPIFKDWEAGLLVEIVLKLRLQVFSPGDYVCRKGDVGKEMYIVKRGQLNVVGDDETTIIATLSDGQVFGEISLLNISGNRRTANVRSVGYSDLFCLRKDDLWSVLREYPEAKNALIIKSRESLLSDSFITDQPVAKATQDQLTFNEKVIQFEQDVKRLEEELVCLLQEFNSVQAKSQE